MKRLRDMISTLARPIANVQTQGQESTKTELQREVAVRGRLSRRTTRLARMLEDYRRQDGALGR